MGKTLLNFLFVRMNKAFLLLLLLVGVALSQAVVRRSKTDCRLKVSKNGRCGPKKGNTRCPSGYCSRWGWCGTSRNHKRGAQLKYSAGKCGKIKIRIKVKGGKRTRVVRRYRK